MTSPGFLSNSYGQEILLRRKHCRFYGGGGQQGTSPLGKALADLRGARDAPSWPKSLQFNVVFGQKIGQTVGWRPHLLRGWHPHVGSPGSATRKDYPKHFCYVTLLSPSFKNPMFSLRSYSTQTCASQRIFKFWTLMI